MKPDGVQRGLVNKVLKRFESRGYKLVGLKLIRASEWLIRAHYKHLQDHACFPGLLDYMCESPVCASVWEGSNVVTAGRAMLGATHPPEWKSGTIRGEYCQVVERCVAHASDTEENAASEIGLWFPEGLFEYDQALSAWLR